MKININNNIRSISFLCVGLLMISGACTTTSEFARNNDDSSLDADANDELSASEEGSRYVYRGPTAVKQIGSTQIAYSKEGYQYWYEMRQSKDPLKRIAGNLAAGQLGQAVNLSKSYLEKNPQDVQALIYLATALALDRKYALAAYYAKAGLRQRPGDAMLLNIAGLSMYMNHAGSSVEQKQAIEFLRASFNNDSSQIASGLNLGGIFLELGKHAEAQVYYQKVASRCGQCTAALLGSGTAYLKHKNYQAAKDSFEKIIAREPAHGPALYNLAVVYRNGYQNKKQAEKYLFTLLNRTNKADYALRARAQTFLRMMKSELDKADRDLVQEQYQNIPHEKGKKDEEEDARMLMTLDEKGN